MAVEESSEGCKTVGSEDAGRDQGSWVTLKTWKRRGNRSSRGADEGLWTLRLETGEIHIRYRTDIIVK